MSLAPLPLAVRDPVRARVATERQAAQKKLTRVVRKGVSDMPPVRARKLLHQIRARLTFLNRTDGVASPTPPPPGPRLWTGEAVMEHALEVAGFNPDDGIPDRAERDRQLAPVLAELAKLAKRAPRRERKPLPTAKETPMSTNRCLVEGHPHHEGAGCVIDDPRAAPPAPPANRAPSPGFPPALSFPAGLVPNIHACEGVYVVPNPDPVRRHRALDLARVVLDHAEQDRVELVASLFYRFLMRSAR